MYDIIVYINGEIFQKYSNISKKEARKIYNHLFDFDCCPDVYKNGKRLSIKKAYQELKNDEMW